MKHINFDTLESLPSFEPIHAQRQLAQDAAEHEKPHKVKARRYRHATEGVDA